MNTNAAFLDQVDQQQTERTHFWGTPAPYKDAQSFKPTLNTLTRVELFCYRKANASGNLKVSIRNNLYSSDLTSKTISVLSLPNGDWLNASWIDFNFPDIGVTPENTYYIVWSLSTSNLDNVSMWGAKMSSSYTRGDRWQYSPPTWGINTNYDMCFKTYGYDNSHPSVSISYPGSEEYISDTVVITGVASDPNGDHELEKVFVRIDDGSWNTASGTTSWSYSWDTTSVDDGEHVIEAKSNDGILDSVIDSVTVNVINDNYPPSVAISYPNDNDTVGGIITVHGEASDTDGNVTKVEVRIDDNGWNTAEGNTIWNYSWDTTNVIDGFHTIYARSYDGDIYSVNCSINVIVNNIYPEVVIDKINGGFRASAEIKNNGTGYVTDVDWYIDLEGGLILAGGYSNGTISELGAGESETVKLDSLFGIGNTVITVTAEDVTKQATGFILGPLVLGV